MKIQVLGAFLLAACWASEAQTLTFNPTPSALIAGGGAQTVTINSTTLANIPFAATWNGVSTPVTVTSSMFPYGTVFKVELTADELAMSQLGQFALYDGRTNTLIASVAIPVVYPVAAAATLYDTGRGQLYITTGASTTLGYPFPTTTPDPRFPVNSLIALDVSTGQVTHVLSFSGAAGAMALSDDGKVLYVGVSNNVVQQVDPDTFAATGAFTLAKTTTSLGTFTPVIFLMAVMPGASQTLAIAYAPDNSTDLTIGIFDNGVERMNTGGYIYSTPNSQRLLFSPDGKSLFYGGYPSSMTQGFPVNASGISNATSQSAAGGAPVAIVGDTLYTATGTSIDWHTMQVTGNLGTGVAAVAVDATNSRLLACFGSSTTVSVLLQAFDLTTQTGFGTLEVPLGVVNLDRFGVDGLIDQSSSSILLFHTPLAGPAPAVTQSGVVNAASFKGGAIAPGEIVSLFGTTLGPVPGAAFTVVNNNVVNPAGMEVWFGRQQGTVLFAQSGQMNVEAPFELEPGASVPLQVWNNGIPSAALSLTVASTAPALFTRDGSGEGLVAVINEDGSIDTAAPRGSVVSLFGTGGGLFPGAADSEVAGSASTLSASVQVSIGGQNAQVLYAGAAPDLVDSVFQLNVQIPSGIAPGSGLPVSVTIGGQSSPQGVTIDVR